MTQYKNLHKWMLIPVGIVLIGFAPSYWLNFTEMPWRIHLHGLTATAWIVLLVAQPYLITRGKVQQHRFYGMLALFLAGGVALSGLGTIPYNLINEQLPEAARYGLSLVDVVLVTGFTVAVAMAIANAKQVDDHARWMVSTVFWIVAPGLFRVLLIPIFAFNLPNPGQLFPLALTASGAIVILALVILMIRDKRMHPAFLSAAIGNLVMLHPLGLGQMAWWQSVANAVFTT